MSHNKRISSNEILIDRHFVDEDHINQHLKCSVCLSIFNDPVRLECGHTFCKKCIKMWIKKHNECPCCRINVTPKDFYPDLMALNLINELEVQCNNFPDCNWKGKLEDLVTHFSSCGKALEAIKSQRKKRLSQSFDNLAYGGMLHFDGGENFVN